MNKSTRVRLLNFLEQVPAVLTVVVAALAAVAIPVLKLDVPTSIALLMAVVALLATTELVSRLRDVVVMKSNLAHTRRLLEAQSSGLISADVFFGDGVPVLRESPLLEASNISFLSVTLLSFLTTHRQVLEARVRAGAKVRIILLSEDDQVLTSASIRQGDKDIKSWKLHRDTSLHYISQIRANLGQKGSLEVRTINFPPAYGITVYDPKSEDGKIIVQLWPHHGKDVASRPYFVLEPGRDSKWFAFFEQQFEITWENATPL